jgi:hypothetical protein
MEIFDYLAKSAGTAMAAVCCLVSLGMSTQWAAEASIIMIPLSIGGLISCAWIAWRNM